MTAPINPQELIKRLRGRLAEWEALAEDSRENKRKESQKMAAFVARGLEEAIEIVEEMAN